MFEFNYVKAKSLAEAQAFIAAHPGGEAAVGRHDADTRH